MSIMEPLKLWIAAPYKLDWLLMLAFCSLQQDPGNNCFIFLFKSAFVGSKLLITESNQAKIRYALGRDVAEKSCLSKVSLKTLNLKIRMSRGGEQVILRLWLEQRRVASALTLCRSLPHLCKHIPLIPYYNTFLTQGRTDAGVTPAKNKSKRKKKLFYNKYLSKNFISWMDSAAKEQLLDLLRFFLFSFL